MKKLLIILLLLPFTELIARAGGGDDGGFFFGDPIKFIFYFGIGFVAFLIMQFRILRTRKRLARFTKLDEAWDFKSLEQMIEDTYFKVQNAWNNENPESITDIISDKMLKKLQVQLNYYKHINRKNVLEKIEFTSAKIISASDYEDNSKDKFKAIVSGSMIDYDLNLDNNKKIGNSGFAESFSEYWIFVRENDYWLLDDITE